MSAHSETSAASRPVLAAWRAWFGRFEGWAAGGVATLLGAASAVAHAPLHIWPLQLAAVTALVWLIDAAAEKENSRLKSAFWRAWCFGFGAFLVGLFWIVNAFLARGPAFAPFGPLADLALAGGLALFWGAGGLICALFWRRDWRRVFLFSAVFGLVEFARGTLFGGLPWNLPAYVWPAGGAVSQSASVLGAYGLSALTLFAFAAPATLAGPDERPWARAAAPILAFTLFGTLFTLGWSRLANAENVVVAGVELRLVQADISQADKWLPENQNDVIERYLSLTRQDGLETRSHVIWPESALPLLLLEQPRVLDSVAATVGSDRVLITGVVRRDATNPVNQRYYNSLIALPIRDGAPDLAGASIYDKHRLVPFGEFTPLGGMLARAAENFGLVALTNIGDGYSAGPGPATLDSVPGVPPFAPQICYESIFPGFTPRAGDRPEWILNVSNDAWFGALVGPIQGFNQARYRAIEEGLPLIRAATGGVTGVVDPYGRITARARAGVDAVVDSPLPVALAPTIYSLVGNAVYIFVVAGAFALGWPRRRR